MAIIKTPSGFDHQRCVTTDKPTMTNKYLVGWRATPPTISHKLMAIPARGGVNAPEFVSYIAQPDTTPAVRDVPCKAYVPLAPGLCHLTRFRFTDSLNANLKFDFSSKITTFIDSLFCFAKHLTTCRQIKKMFF